MKQILVYLTNNWNAILQLDSQGPDISLLAVLFAIIIVISLGIFSTRCKGHEKHNLYIMNADWATGG